MQTNEWAGDGGVTDKRERARMMVGRIAEQAKEALADAKIGLDLFFLVPSDGPIITFGTMSDPDQEIWGRVGDIVSKIVQETVGLNRVCHREVACAATHDHLIPAEVRPTDQGAVPMPIPVLAPLLRVEANQP